MENTKEITPASRPIDLLIGALASSSTDDIRTAIIDLGGASLETEAERMSRAALIEVYAARQGQEAADAIMDEIGL